MNDKIPPLHPGEILLEEFIKPLGISQYKLAKDIDVSQMKISAIVNKKRSITPDTARRFSKYFDTSVEFWTGLQSDFDVEIAMDNRELSDSLDRIQPLLKNMHPA